MFDNIGGKIKTLAQVICWIGIIASVIWAISLWSQNSRYYNTIGLGFGVLVGGSLSSWLGSFFMYGFGELIEETTLNRQINAEILKHLSAGERTENKGETQLRDVPVAFNNARAHQSFVRASTVNGTTERWKCAKCGTMNDRATIMCKDCGTYK